MTTIVIVEDDDGIRTAVQNLLEDEGYPTVAFASGADALTYLHDHPAPCLILTDWLMPQMQGDEVIRRAQEAFGVGTHAYILFAARPRHSLSAETQTLLAQAHIPFLMKPFEISSLLATVQVEVNSLA